MDEILQELRALREEVVGLKDQLGGGARVPRVPKPPRTPCIGVTGKGTACRNSAQPGSNRTTMARPAYHFPTYASVLERCVRMNKKGRHA